jgi:endogenous inhibitor of DNA gyrase (YacG/DUF329 family)
MTDDQPTSRVVRCPTCRKSARYDATNIYRPFCSARCKNEDIIGWAEESFRIAEESTDEEGGESAAPAPKDDPEEP